MRLIHGDEIQNRARQQRHREAVSPHCQVAEPTQALQPRQALNARIRRRVPAVIDMGAEQLRRNSRRGRGNGIGEILREVRRQLPVDVSVRSSFPR